MLAGNCNAMGINLFRRIAHEYWTEMERSGKFKRAWLRVLLDLPKGIPSHETVLRVFAALDAKQLRSWFATWVEGMLPGGAAGYIALHGKRFRRTCGLSSGEEIIRRINADAHENGPMFARGRENDKSNEITAFPKSLPTVSCRLIHGLPEVHGKANCLAGR